MPFLILDGPKLRDIRQRKGLSQVVLAERCNIDRRSIGRAEASKPISFPTGRRLAEELHIRLERVVTEVIDNKIGRKAIQRSRTERGRTNGTKGKRRR